MPRPCKLTFDLLTLRVHGVRVTCDVAYLCANFSLPIPLCSRLRPHVRDRQTSDVRRASSLNAPTLGAGHNNGGNNVFQKTTGLRPIAGFVPPPPQLRVLRGCDRGTMHVRKKSWIEGNQIRL